MIKKSKIAVAVAALILAGAAFAEAGVTQSEIRIGSSLALSGTAAGSGLAMQQGVNAYFSQHPKVNGRTVKILWKDDGYEPARAVANTKEMLDEKNGGGVLALAFSFGSATAAAVKPLVAATKDLVYFAPLSGSGALRDMNNEANKKIFNFRASYSEETSRIVDVLLTEDPRMSVLLIVQEDAYGKVIQSGIEKAMSARGRHPAEVVFIPRNSTDSVKAIEAIKRVQPGAVVFGTLAPATAPTLLAFKDVHGAKRPLFFGVSPLSLEELRNLAGDAAVGFQSTEIVPNPQAVVVPLVAAYQRDMKASGYKDFSHTSLEYYAAAATMAHSLELAGKDITRAKLLAAMRSLEGFDVGGYQTTYTEDSNAGSSMVEVVMLGRNRKYIQ